MTPQASRLKARPPLKMSCVRDAGGALTFTLPVPPSANRWWRKFRNRMVLSPEAREYKWLVRMIYRKQELRGDVGVSIAWYRERRSGDLDKRIGVVLDALQGVAYANDAQITELAADRYEDAKNPRIVVTVFQKEKPSPLTLTES